MSALFGLTFSTIQLFEQKKEFKRCLQINCFSIFTGWNKLPFLTVDFSIFIKAPVIHFVPNYRNQAAQTSQ
jgi:hypothetical protein